MVPNTQAHELPHQEGITGRMKEPRSLRSRLFGYLLLVRPRWSKTIPPIRIMPIAISAISVQ